MSINRGRCGLAKYALISVSEGSPPQLAPANHHSLIPTAGSSRPIVASPALTITQTWGHCAAYLCYGFIVVVFLMSSSRVRHPPGGGEGRTCSNTVLKCHNRRTCRTRRSLYIHVWHFHGNVCIYSRINCLLIKQQCTQTVAVISSLVWSSESVTARQGNGSVVWDWGGNGWKVLYKIKVMYHSTQTTNWSNFTKFYNYVTYLLLIKITSVLSGHQLMLC